jgi:hypothetical protein
MFGGYEALPPQLLTAVTVLPGGPPLSVFVSDGHMNEEMTALYAETLANAP